MYKEKFSKLVKDHSFPVLCGSKPSHRHYS